MIVRSAVRRAVVVAIACGVIALGVPFSAFAEKIRMNWYGVSSGLPQNAVTAVAEDTTGFIWLGTQDGLARFDGYSFELFSAAPGQVHNVNDLAVTPDNTLWVATTAGLFAVTPDRNAMRVVEGELLSEEADVSSIAVGSDAVYIVVIGEGIARIEDPGDGGENSLEWWVRRRDIVDIAVTPDGAVVAAGGDGVVAYQNGTNGITSRRVTDLSAHTVAALPDSRLLLAAATTLYDAVPASGGGYVVRAVASDVYVNAIVADVNGNDGVFVGTRSRGVIHFEDDFRRRMNYERGVVDGALRSNTIESLFIDRRGTVWIGTRGSGLHTIDRYKTGFRYIGAVPDLGTAETDIVTLPGLTNPIVVSFAEWSPGDLFIGTFGGGLHRYSDETFSVQRWSRGVNDDRVMGLLRDTRDRLWIGTKGGGLQLLGEVPESGEPPPPADAFRTIPSAHPWVYTIAEHPDGSIWAATQGGGITRVDPDTLGTETIVESLPSPTLRTLSILSNGEVWVGTTDAGLVRLDAAGNAIATYPGRGDDARGLRGAHVLAITETARGIWVGTVGGGLHRYIPESDRFVSYGVDSGLPNATVYGVLPDAQGFLWLSTNAGLARFDPTSERVVEVYGAGDGIQSDEFNAGAFLRGASGILYFGGINGVTSFDPRTVALNPHPPDIAFTGFQVGNKRVAVGERTADGRVVLPRELNRLGELVLTQDEIVIGFEFAPLHYSEPRDNKITYFLDGLESTWNTVTDRRQTTYTSLPHGSYVFRIKARSSDGVWSPERALTVRVLPRFYQTVLFRGGVFFLVIALVFAFVSIRTRTIARQKVALERTVAERTEELTRAQEQERAALRRLAEQEKMESLINFVARLAHRLNTPMGAAITALSYAQTSLERGASRRDDAPAEQAGFAESGAIAPASTEAASTEPNAPASDQVLHSIEIAAEQISTATRLVDHLRRTTERDDDIYLDVVDLCAVVASFSFIQAESLRAAGIALETEYPDAPVTVRAHGGDLTLILDELVDNSVRHAFPRQFTGERRIVITVSDAEDHVQLNVQDNGVGIDPEREHHVLEPWESTGTIGVSGERDRRSADRVPIPPNGVERRRGSGMGLFSVYTLVTGKLGGTLRLRNRDGAVSGMCIEVTIPKSVPPSQGTDSGSADPS